MSAEALITTTRGRVLHHSVSLAAGPICGTRARYPWRRPTRTKARRRMCRYCLNLRPARIVLEHLDADDIVAAAYAANDLAELAKVITAACLLGSTTIVERLDGHRATLHRLIAERRTAIRADERDIKSARIAATSTAIADDEVPFHALGRW